MGYQEYCRHDFGPNPSSKRPKLQPKPRRLSDRASCRLKSVRPFKFSATHSPTSEDNWLRVFSEQLERSSSSPMTMSSGRLPSLCTCLQASSRMHVSALWVDFIELVDKLLLLLLISMFGRHSLRDDSGFARSTWRLQSAWTEEYHVYPVERLPIEGLS
jgi:hypothetical protein